MCTRSRSRRVQWILFLFDPWPKIFGISFFLLPLISSGYEPKSTVYSTSILLPAVLQKVRISISIFEFSFFVPYPIPCPTWLCVNIFDALTHYYLIWLYRPSTVHTGPALCWSRASHVGANWLPPLKRLNSLLIIAGSSSILCMKLPVAAAFTLFVLLERKVIGIRSTIPETCTSISLRMTTTLLPALPRAHAMMLGKRILQLSTVSLSSMVLEKKLPKSFGIVDAPTISFFISAALSLSPSMQLDPEISTILQLAAWQLFLQGSLILSIFSSPRMVNVTGDRYGEERRKKYLLLSTLFAFLLAAGGSFLGGFLSYYLLQNPKITLLPFRRSQKILELVLFQLHRRWQLHWWHGQLFRGRWLPRYTQRHQCNWHWGNGTVFLSFEYHQV